MYVSRMLYLPSLHLDKFTCTVTLHPVSSSKIFVKTVLCIVGKLRNQYNNRFWSGDKSIQSTLIINKKN